MIFPNSSPDRKSIERLHVVTSDDTKAASAAFECLPQISITCCIGLNDAAVGEDDFEVDDIVCGESTLVQVIGEAAAQEEAACSN